MSHRKIRTLFTIAVTLLSLSTNAEAKPPKPLKLGTLAPRGSSFHQTLQRMGVSWKSAGAPITIYAGGSRGGEAEMVRLMRTGTLDAGLFTATGLSEIDTSVEALQSTPMMFDSLEEMDYVSERLRIRLEENLREKGFVVLFWADAGWVRFFSKKPIATPADMKKLKLFTWAGDVDTFDIYKSAGFKPVALETADILPALQTGMIDAVPMSPTIALALQVYTPAKHMLQLNWAPFIGAFVVREKVWNGFTPDIKRQLASAAADAGKNMKALNRLESDRAVEAMKKNGLQVQTVSKEVEAEWRRAAEQTYPSLRGKVVPAPLFDEVRSLITEYRNSRKPTANAKK